MDLEQEAKTLGWVPKEQFRGDPERWTDAETFVTRGKEIMPILRKNNEKLVGEVGALKGELTQLQSTVAEAKDALKAFKEYHEDTSKRAYDAAMRDLRAQKAEAIKEADGDKVVQVEEAIDKLTEDAAKARLPVAAPAPAAVPAATPHPDFVAWEKDNSAWLAEDDKKAYAHSIGGYVRAMNPSVQGRAFLDLVTAEVEKHFGGPSPSQKVEGGSTPTKRSGRGYGDLPTEAKQACDRFAARLVGPGKAFKSVEEFRSNYVKTYDWS
jgi:hypothetical protein